MDIALSEVALAGEFVHYFEHFDFLLDGLPRDLTPVDLGVVLHALLQVVVNVDRNCRHINCCVYTEYCVFRCV